MKSTKKRIWFLLLAPFALLVSFNNCSKMGPVAEIGEESSLSMAVSEDCLDSLKKTFATTYHPFLKNSCNGCHSSAHGSLDLDTSFRSFSSFGRAEVDRRAVTAHGGNNFGPYMQTNLNVFKSKYDRAQSDYNLCLELAVENRGNEAPATTTTTTTTTVVTAPPTTIPTTTTSTIPRTVVTWNQLVGTNSSLNVFAQSCTNCHGNSRALGGLNLMIYSQARAAAQEIYSRMTEGLAPMPPSGLLPQSRRDLVKTWLDAGAPQ